MELRERITIEPGKRGGKPCIRGLRITVEDVLDYLASGMDAPIVRSTLPKYPKADGRYAKSFDWQDHNHPIQGP